MRTYSPGDIVEVIFPFEENGGSKQRPALVLADEGESFIVAKVTSQHKGRKWDVLLPRSSENGLNVDSVVQVDKARKLSKKELCDVISRGNINPLQMALILDKAKEYRESLRK